MHGRANARSGCRQNCCQRVMSLVVAIFICSWPVVAGFAEASGTHVGRELWSPVRIAIVGIENGTGDPSVSIWRGEILKLLKSSLAEVRSLRVLSVANGERMEAAAARSMGEQVEAGRVLWGSYRQQNGAWSVSFYCENTATGRVSKALTAVSEDWYEVRDRLVDQILRELKVNPSQAEMQRMRWRSTTSETALECLAKLDAVGEVSVSEGLLLARQAVKADPKSPETHMQLACFLGTAGDLPAAVKEARFSAKLEPRFGLAHWTLGTGLFLQGKIKEGIKELELARELDPTEAEGLARLAEVYSSEGQMQKGVTCYREALELEPGMPSFHARLGLLYATQGKRERAVTELREAARLGAETEVNIDGVKSEQALCQAYEALHELPAAIYHTQRFVNTAKRVGVSAELIGTFERKLEQLQARERPTSVDVLPPTNYTEKNFEVGLGQKLTDREARRVVNPLTATAEMKSWAWRVTAEATNDLLKARALFDALTQHTEFDGGAARTAQEAFAAWKKPNESLLCQEYAYLYIALARAVGLKAYDVAVYETCDGSKALHACAVVFASGQALLVDPAYYWFGVPHKKFRVLDDLQAAASYLSERGSRSDCEIAAKLDPDSVSVQTKLALILMKQERWAEAQKAIAAVSRVDPTGWLTDYVRAGWAIHEENLDRALALLQEACGINPDDGPTRLAMGYAYEMQQKLAEARESFVAALRCTLERQAEVEARREVVKIDQKMGG